MQISDLETSLVYKVSSRAASGRQRNHVSKSATILTTKTKKNNKNKTKQTNNKKKTLLSSQVTVKPLSSVPCAQKFPLITSGTPTTVRCKQAVPEYSIPVQETLDFLLTIPGVSRTFSIFPTEARELVNMVESQDTSPIFQSTTVPLPHPSSHTGYSQPDQ